MGSHLLQPQIRLSHVLVLDEAAARPFEGQPSILEHTRAIGHFQRLFDILLDEQDGNTVLRK